MKVRYTPNNVKEKKFIEEAESNLDNNNIGHSFFFFYFEEKYAPKMAAEEIQQINFRSNQYPDFFLNLKPHIELTIPNNSCEHLGLSKGTVVNVRAQPSFQNDDVLFLTDKEKQYTIATVESKDGCQYLRDQSSDKLLKYPLDKRFFVIGKILNIQVNFNQYNSTKMNDLSKNNDMKFIQTNFEDNHGVNISGNNNNISITLSDGKVDVKAKPVEDAVVVTEDSKDTDVELCHFIHPSIVDDKERSKIHKEILNLINTNNVQMICSYLGKMADDNRILLPPEPQFALAELQRLGMPDGEGYTYKTFTKYYKK